MKGAAKAAIVVLSLSVLAGGAVAGGIWIDQLNQSGKISLYPTASTSSKSQNTGTGEEYALAIKTDQHGVILKTLSQSADPLGRPRRVYSYSIPPTTTSDQSVKIDFDWNVVTNKDPEAFLSVEDSDEDHELTIIALRFFTDPIEITVTSKEDQSKYAVIEVTVEEL